MGGCGSDAHPALLLYPSTDHKHAIPNRRGITGSQQCSGGPLSARKCLTHHPVSYTYKGLALDSAEIRDMQMSPALPESSSHAQLTLQWRQSTGVWTATWTSGRPKDFEVSDKQAKKHLMYTQLHRQRCRYLWTVKCLGVFFTIKAGYFSG